MDLKLRNKEVKEILTKEFGRGNVSVTNGRGTAYGWCHIEIKIGIDCADINNTCSGCAGDNNGVCRINNKPVLNNGWLNSARQLKHTEVINKVDSLLKSCEFYSYSDDMGGEHKEYTTQIRWIK